MFSGYDLIFVSSHEKGQSFRVMGNVFCINPLAVGGAAGVSGEKGANTRQPTPSPPTHPPTQTSPHAVFLKCGQLYLSRRAKCISRQKREQTYPHSNQTQFLDNPYCWQKPTNPVYELVWRRRAEHVFGQFLLTRTSVCTCTTHIPFSPVFGRWLFPFLTLFSCIHVSI